jgi:hypothetical protein
MILGLLALGEATELRALRKLFEVFLPAREASYCLVRLELLRVILALGIPAASPPEGAARMRSVAIAGVPGHVVSSS